MLKKVLLVGAFTCAALGTAAPAYASSVCVDVYVQVNDQVVAQQQCQDLP